MRRLLPIALLLLGACAHVSPESDSGMSSLRVQADSAGVPVTVAAVDEAYAQIGQAGHGRYRFDVFVQRSERGGELVYEARVLVSDAVTANLRHMVRSTASAHTGRHGLTTELEQRVAAAATQRAALEAVAMID